MITKSSVPSKSFIFGFNRVLMEVEQRGYIYTLILMPYKFYFLTSTSSSLLIST